MSLRQSLREKPTLVITVGAVALLAVGASLFAFMRGNSRGPSSGGDRLAFFSIDDGKTWFADDVNKIPPFQKDGKEAVLAHVYRAPDGTKFVNHLERFKPEAQRALQAARSAAAAAAAATSPVQQNHSSVQSAYMGGREVKRPGDATWVSAANFREAAQVTAIRCPNGGREAEAVEP
jgi:hypothetical protein